MFELFSKQSLAKAYNLAKTFAKDMVTFISIFVSEYISDFQRRHKARIQRISNTISGIISFASTLQTSLKVTPIIFSILTVLTAVPLVHFLLPNFIFEPLVFIPVLTAISAIVGYRTYKDAIQRERLDTQIEIDANEIKQLNQRISILEQQLTTMLEPRSASIIEDKSTLLLSETALNKTSSSIVLDTVAQVHNQHSCALR